MKRLPLLLIFVITSACAQNTKDPVAFKALWVKDAEPFDLNDDFFAQMKQDQQDMLAKLTGRLPIENDIRLQRRFDPDERELSRAYFTGQLAKLGIEPLEHSYEMRLPQLNNQQNPAKGTNLYAIIPATVPSDEYILLGAHYDTVKESPGASDNATGCALVYGVASAMIRQKTRSKNLLIVFLDKEEVGHAGALAFAKFLKERQMNIHSVHTADQVGWDADGDRSIELEIPTKKLKAAYRKNAQKFDVKAYSTRETGSDHKEFRDTGFKAVGITEEYRKGDTSPYHHDPKDTYETVDFEYLGFVTYLVFNTLMDLMNEQ